MAEIKFEDALKKLEKIVADLEKENLTLNTALKKFEEGIKLSRICSKRLKEAESKFEILVKDEAGKIKKEPFVLGEKKKEDLLF